MKTKKRLRSLIVFSIIILILAGAGVALKNIVLFQIKKKIQSNFDYTDLYMSFFPPALVIENVRTHSLSPFFSADKVAVKISYKSLLTKERPFNVFIERPILRIYERPSESGRAERTRFPITLPFSIEKGVVKGGELYFWGKDVSFRSKGIKAIFAQKKNQFSFQSEAEENIFSLSSVQQQIEAEVSLSVEGRDREIRVKKFRANGPGFILKAQGSLIDPFDPNIHLETSIKIRTGLIAELFTLPFDWEGKADGEGTLTRKDGEVAFQTAFSSSSLVLNKVSLGNVEGKFEYIHGTGGTVEFNSRRGNLPREFVRIHFTEGKVEGIARGFHLDPIMNHVALPWPVRSPAWGSLTIDGEKLRAEAEFRDRDFQEQNGKFPFRGKVSFEWDRKNRFSLSSQSLISSFAELEVKGEANIGRDVELYIKGGVSDLNQARRFTSIILGKKFTFPEIRGRGRAEVRIFGDYAHPQISADFSFSPGGFDKLDAFSVEGKAESINNEFLGRFNIDDPSFKGRISLHSTKERTKANIWLDRGLVEKILPALDLGIDLPLQGEGSGNFEFEQTGEDRQFKGTFSSSSMKFANQNLSSVRGKLEWLGDSFSFPEIQFNLHRGKIGGYALLQPLGEGFDINLRGENIDLSSLYAGLEGNLKFNLEGKGVLGRDLASGHFEIDDLYLAPFQKTASNGEVKLGYSEERINLDLNGNFLPGDNEFQVSFAIPIVGNMFSANVRGSFTNLDLLIPWEGAEGRVNYLGEIRVQAGLPQIKGGVDFKGPIFPFPRFAHAIRDYSGLMYVENNKITLRSFLAKLGGGDVQGSGELRLGKGNVENIDLKIEGKNLLLSPLERTRALAEGTLNLAKDTDRFLLEGDLLVQRLSWRRELHEKFAFSSIPYYESQREPGFFDDLTLNVRIRANDNAWMENSLGRIRGRFDLTLTGNVNAPIVLGEIEAIGGDVYFQDRKFRILSGRVGFFNPLTIEPFLSFKGETYVKDYRVTFSLEGPIERLNPEFSSSPPLPPEDVLALLALGESFKRTYSYDTSTQLSTASLLSFQLSEEAKKRAEGLFSIDRFRIDPFIMGTSAEMTARLTIGKKISKNFFILYSTNLATQKEEIARLEWELTNDLSIVGTRDEKGRVSIDVKIHKRF
ncbi:MAG: translocation/assembly module TamB domain-containing protein [Candidatus Aminicenantes bacterium]|nr:MAG: translocation/assembly module TamB domain-containing protein [Candidatus Aminicenantes bacterium]